MLREKAFVEFPTIETEKLVLRRIVPSDSAALFAVLSDEETVKFYDDDAFIEISQAGDQITSWEKGYRDRWCLRWGITKKDDQELIGSCGFYGIHYWYQKASVGYELHRDHWRKGIMTEVLAAVLDFGFEQMGINRIDALVMPGNAGSFNLLERVGFQREGLLKQYERWGSKGFVDLYLYALLKEQWKSQK